jgi:hypothetical protein
MKKIDDVITTNSSQDQTTMNRVNHPAMTPHDGHSFLYEQGSGFRNAPGGGAVVPYAPDRNDDNSSRISRWYPMMRGTNPFSRLHSGAATSLQAAHRPTLHGSAMWGTIAADSTGSGLSVERES